MEMLYNNLGKSGLKVSALSFGSWVTFGSQVEDNTAEDCLRLAYDSGINFFDNAEAYANGKSEVVMGNILKKMKWPRDSFVVSSKVFFGSEGKGPNQKGLSRKHVIEACHAAMRRLQVDYLDLYFCHRPDPETPIEETVRAMNTLIEQGKVFYWGTSEWSAQQIQEAKAVADANHLIGPTMEQPQYNLLHRDKVENEFAPLYKSKDGLGTTIWSPLSSGLLTGKYNDGIPEGSRLAHVDWLKDMMTNDPEAWKRRINTVKSLTKIADEIGVSLADLSIAWCLKNDNVSTVILGASKVEQLKSNLNALNVVKKLDDSVMEKIEDALQV